MIGIHARLACRLALCAGAAGCRPAGEEPQREPVSAVARAAGTVVTTATATDTVGPAGEDTTPGRRAPGDRCRYADARRQARPGDANFGAWYDTAAMSRGVTLRCLLRDGGPEARVVVLGRYGIPMAADIYVPAGAARPLQRVFMEDNDQHAVEGGTLAEGFDLNRDGWTDLKVQTWSGSGGVSYDLFMYDPRARRFVRDSVLPGGGGIEPLRRREPCVGTGIRSGVGNFDDHEYCWRGGHWAHVRELRQERLGGLDGNTRYVLTVREPRGGRMVTVRVDTSATDAAGEP
ncbi:MAG TPA: hypothetical protein VFJ16_25890 [Longimicrobium sp.]|nr:hypothetical protein [Longimicrobium sp.]